jgi:UDP-N-acetylglucosamine--N-acetylmuramyl-(pentapeptide) pyrophosphoryl-undecaprenol N-acetylglucosamine transferase
LKKPGKLPNRFCRHNLLLQICFTDGLAYSVADLVISRAGAGSIPNCACWEKPVILVPSPNVAEDHQTKNALALVQKEAAVLIKDEEAEKILVPKALALIKDTDALNKTEPKYQKNGTERFCRTNCCRSNKANSEKN